LHRHRLVGQAGEDNDGHIGCRLVQPIERGEPLAVGQRQVQQHRIGQAEGEVLLPRRQAIGAGEVDGVIGHLAQH
jgi:hypothetical protein